MGARQPEEAARPEEVSLREARGRPGGPGEGQAAGGSQGSVPMSAGRLTSTSSKVSEVAISLWGVPPGMYMLSPASIRTTLPPANSRSTQPSSM